MDKFNFDLDYSILRTIMVDGIILHEHLIRYCIIDLVDGLDF